MKEDQRAVLELALALFSSELTSISGINYRNATIPPADPTPIYDINGKELFYDVDLVSQTGEIIGFIRTSAGINSIPLIDSISLGKTPSKAVLMDRAREALLQATPTAVIKNTRLVCYGYPYIGVMFDYSVNGSSRWTIYNPYSKSEVKSGALENVPVSLAIEGSHDSIEGEPFYSILDNLPEAGIDPTAAEMQWKLLYKLYQQTSTPTTLGEVDASTSSPAIRLAVARKILPVPLISQARAAYCVVATAAMILSYLGENKIDQDALASELGTQKEGTPPANLEAKLSGLIGNRISVTNKQLPTYLDFVSALDEDLPVKSGIPRHSRLVRGYQEFKFLNSSGECMITERFLIVNDPQPVGVGGVVLESVIKPLSDYFRNALVLKWPS